MVGFTVFDSLEGFGLGNDGAALACYADLGAVFQEAPLDLRWHLLYFPLLLVSFLLATSITSQNTHCTIFHMQGEGKTVKRTPGCSGLVY